MNIADFPRENVAHLPTPLSFMPNFSEAVGKIDVWIKRDDETGLATGGNKARKLEYLVGEAKSQNADVLLTTGGLQSNHARMTAAAAAASGLKSVLFLTGEDPGARQGNLLLDELLGAQIQFIGEQDAECAMQKYAEQLKEDGYTPYIIPLGGSVPVGCVGYINAGYEFLQQVIQHKLKIDHVVMATGSGGTAAGLLVALATLAPRVTLHGISVSREAELMREQILNLADETLAYLGWPETNCSDQLRVYDDYVGEGYAVPTKEGIEAGHLLARTEGILVDTTYTGKALAGLVGLVEEDRFSPGDTVLFWHTGGVPALFSVAEEYSSLWEDADK